MDLSSEQDEHPKDGYSLVSQNFENADDEDEDEDEEFLRFATSRSLTSTEEKKATHPIDSSQSIWNDSLQTESFPVDDEKAETIKTLMLNIQLPRSSFPAWTETCREEDWTEKLREQITCRQTTFFSDENKKLAEEKDAEKKK